MTIQEPDQGRNATPEEEHRFAWENFEHTLRHIGDVEALYGALIDGFEELRKMMDSDAFVNVMDVLEAKLSPVLAAQPGWEHMREARR